MQNQNPSPDFVNSSEILSGLITGPLESGQVPTMEENPSPEFTKSDEISLESITKTLEFDDCKSDEFDNSLLGNGKADEILGECLLVVENDSQVIENVEEIKEYDSPNLHCSENEGILSGSYSIEGDNECSEMYDLTDREPAKPFYPFSGWSEPEPCPVGAGLSNLGNTCFLNVIIQCFTHTVPFVEALFSLKHDASAHGQYDFCILCTVRDQIERALAFSGKIVSPSNLVDNLSNISSSFERYHQEDAHEFLQCLFDKLDCNWSKQVSNAKKLSTCQDSLVKQVFGGCLVSQLRCCKCGYNSESYEPMNDLSLEIENVDDLESAFKSFTKVENLEDTADCDSCKEKVQREKQLLLDQAPPIAALHLKRFKSDGIYVEKIDKRVEYPLELDLEPYIKGDRDNNDKLHYELYGVVVHVGLSSNSGHYFCYIRTSPDLWYRFDDSKVTRVSKETALGQEAYILFYARKGTPWFGDLLEKWKVHLEDKLNTSPKSVFDSQEFDKRDASPVTYAEPICCLLPDEVEEEPEVQIQASARENNFPNNLSTSPSFSHDVGEEGGKDETPKINFGKRFLASVKKQPAAAVSYKIPVDHLKVEEKPSTLLASAAAAVIKKGEQSEERKEAAKYIRSSSMPIGRRQMLLAAMNASRSDTQSRSQDRSKQSSPIDTRTPNKRSSRSAEHTSKKRLKISCP